MLAKYLIAAGIVRRGPEQGRRQHRPRRAVAIDRRGAAALVARTRPIRGLHRCRRRRHDRRLRRRERRGARALERRWTGHRPRLRSGGAAPAGRPRRCRDGRDLRACRPARLARRPRAPRRAPDRDRARRRQPDRRCRATPTSSCSAGPTGSPSSTGRPMRCAASRRRHVRRRRLGAAPPTRDPDFVAATDPAPQRGRLPGRLDAASRCSTPRAASSASIAIDAPLVGPARRPRQRGRPAAARPHRGGRRQRRAPRDARAGWPPSTPTRRLLTDLVPLPGRPVAHRLPGDRQHRLRGRRLGGGRAGRLADRAAHRQPQRHERRPRRLRPDDAPGAGPGDGLRHQRRQPGGRPRPTHPEHRGRRAGPPRRRQQRVRLAAGRRGVRCAAGGARLPAGRHHVRPAADRVCWPPASWRSTA